MGHISYFDIWQTYDHETMTDEDLLLFAKGLFKEGFIRVSTVYDEELDKNVTRYDMNASKTVKTHTKSASSESTPTSEKTDDTDELDGGKSKESIPDSKDENWFLKLFKSNEKDIT